MFIELSQLPQVVQEQILNEQTEIVQIINNGQIVKTLQVGEPICEDECYFDIEQMQTAIDSPSVEIPKSALKDLASFEQFLKASFV